MRRSKLFNLPHGSYPPLNSSLSVLYNGLSEDNKRIFVKVFGYLWSVVAPVSRFVGYSGVLHSFWVVDLLRNKYKLDNTALSLLSFLYYATDKGTRFVNSKAIYDGLVLPHIIEGTKCRELYNLKQRGFITRSWNNPDEPYLKKSYRSRPVFINLTSAGISMIKSIEKDLYNILMCISKNELTGRTAKRPDPLNKYK